MPSDEDYKTLLRKIGAAKVAKILHQAKLARQPHHSVESDARIPAPTPEGVAGPKPRKGDVSTSPGKALAEPGANSAPSISPGDRF